MSFTPDTDLVDRVVPSPAGEVWSRGGAPILGIAIHMAEGGGTENYLDNLDGNSSHYVIKYSGELVQMVPEAKAAGSMNPTLTRDDDDAAFTNYLGERIRYGITALKAVLGGWHRDANRVSIAIEIEGFAGKNTSTLADPLGGPNDKQERTLVALVNDIRDRRGALPAFGHRDQQKYKACPGRRIPWRLLGGHAVIPSSEAEPVPLTVTGVIATPGTVTIANISGVQAVQIDNPTQRFGMAAGSTKEVIGLGRLEGDPLGKNATLGSEVYVTGDELAIIFKSQVESFSADGVSEDQIAAIVAEAIAADRAKARPAVVWE